MKRPPFAKNGSTALERSYRTALAQHVRTANDSGAGERLGRRALSLGVETLALARMHDRAPTASTARGDAFFAQAVAVMTTAPDDASEALAECTRLAETLEARASELTAVRARLADESARGKALKAELRDATRRHADLLERSRLIEERTRALSHRLLSAQEEERMRISRDLHDAIGQTLTGINVGLATLKNESAADSRELAAAITLTQQLVERSMKTVHQFAWELRPTLLDDLGLVPALRSYAKTFSERSGIKVRFAADAGFEKLDGDRRTALFRVAQGALSNVERHAAAAHASLVVRAVPGAVRLEVRDNGRTFDVKRMENSKTNRHLGLMVMRERVEMVGGSFEILSSPGRGTTVRADIPFEEASRA